MGLEHSPDTPCTHRCFVNMFYGGTRDFYSTPRGKLCLPGICCQLTTAGQEQHMLQLALGSVCVLRMEMMLARQESPSLSCIWLPPVWAGKRPGRRSDLLSLHLQSLWVRGWAGTGGLSSTSTSESNDHTNTMPGKCFPSLPLETPGTTSPDPPPQLHICAVTPASHSAVVCHPPSQSITVCLSSLVLFCFFFCSLPACSFSNF